MPSSITKVVVISSSIILVTAYVLFQAGCFTSAPVTETPKKPSLNESVVDSESIPETMSPLEPRNGTASSGADSTMKELRIVDEKKTDYEMMWSSKSAIVFEKEELKALFPDTTKVNSIEIK